MRCLWQQIFAIWELLLLAPGYYLCRGSGETPTGRGIRRDASCSRHDLERGRDPREKSTAEKNHVDPNGQPFPPNMMIKAA